MGRIRIGIVGAGERGCYVLGTRIVELSRELDMEITAICDCSSGRIGDAIGYLRHLCASRNLDWGSSIDGTPRFEDLVDNPRVDLVLVTTHTDQHRAPAIYALRSGKHVYLDKPIAVTLEDSQAIIDTERETGNPLIMGFTRRYERSWRMVREALRSGIVGTLQLMQIRSIIPYTRYLQMWHRRNAWSGGALNDKSSHHLDVFNWMAGSQCIQVGAVGGRSGLFEPREDAPLRCASCSDLSCPYRRTPDSTDDKEGTHVLHLPSWRDAVDERDVADTCVYRPGADIIDHAVCTYVYESGVKASLFWAIYGPHADDQETLELIGSRGRIVLERSTARIRVHAIGDGPNNETITVMDTRDENFASSHYGADIQLLRDIRSFCDLRDAGKPVDSLGCASAADGDEALRMIKATIASIEKQGTPVPLHRKDIGSAAAEGAER